MPYEDPLIWILAFFQISPDLEISQCEEAHIVTVPEEDLNQLSSKLTSELVLTFQILFTKHLRFWFVQKCGKRIGTYLYFANLAYIL